MAYRILPGKTEWIKGVRHVNNFAWIYNTPDIQGAAVVMVVVAATVVGSARKMENGLSQDNKQNPALLHSHISLTAECGAKTVILSILVLKARYFFDMVCNLL